MIMKKSSVVTIGNFDGVHLGHQKILALTIDQAGQSDARSVAFTFRPHPQSVLRPDRAPALLLSYDEKRELLLSFGMDEVIEQSFSQQFAGTTPEIFFEQVLLGALSARALVVGYDFTFGRERTGHLQVLERLCAGAGIEFTVVPPHRVDSEVVSSSVIRQALASGRVDEAALGLGRPFFYRGPVLRGDQRGRELGFPTANLLLDSSPAGKLVLPYGVYATRLVHEQQAYAAVTNVGVRPTFQSSLSAELSVLVETHVLDQSLDLYGKMVRVEFVRKIRDEQKFQSGQELQVAIKSDISRARQILGC